MKKKRKWIVWLGGAAALLILLHLGFLGEYNFYHLLQKKRQVQRLGEEIQSNEAAIENLQLEIKRLKSDSAYIEKMARERYKMGKPDETIYIIDSEEKK